MMQVWQAARGWRQRFGLTSLVHAFPFYSILSSVGWELKTGTEMRWA